MNVNLTITTEQAQGSVPVMIFHLHGWLDWQSENQLVQAAEEAHQQGGRYLLLDLGGVDMITSAGMRAIQRAFTLYNPKQAGKASPGLKMCNASPKIYAILDMAGFLQNIPNFESIQTAVSSFTPQN